MAVPDAARPLDMILSRLDGVRKTGDGYTARCPAHDDRQQSLSVGEGKDGEVLLHCFAGCQAEEIVTALGLTMADLFVRKEPRRDTKPEGRSRDSKPAEDLTVEALAQDKGLPAEFLKNHGVQQGAHGVMITYRLMDGSPAPRQRWRTALSAKLGSAWNRGGKGAPVPYGLWMLQGMRKKSDSLVLVEGESDSWTLWYHKIPALGIPGADMAKTLELSHVESFARILIFKEPDKGGDTFAAGIAARLAALNYRGDARVINPARFKDPNELHKRLIESEASDVGAFARRFELLMDAAEPIDLSALASQQPVSKLALGPEFGLTDLGNARRLVRRHAKDLRYCFPWEKWLVWDGARWVFDTTGEVHRRAKETVASIYAEASEGDDPKEREQLAKHAMRSESDTRIRAMIHLAQSEPGIPVQPEDFDADPWRLNVQNGILDLRTMTLSPHSRDALLTKLVPVAYDPEAPCPLWDSFLETVTNNNQALTSYLQRVVGYTLTGDTREQCLFLLYGTGANGKSTFLETLKGLFGDYGQQADFSTFLHSDQDRVRNDIARLRGSRFVAATEADAGRRLGETLVKQVTGGDTVTARFLFKEAFEFKPTFKVFLAANSKPTIRGQDHGIWRRIRLIPFEVKIPKEKQDKNLAHRLRAELPGILAWAVEGCRAWLKGGLQDPSEVLSATESYKEEMDVLAGFVAECCVVSRAAQVTTKALYAEYLKWCEENSERPLSKNPFSTRLKEKGFETARLGSKQVRGWFGIGLMDEMHQGALMDEQTDSYVDEQGNREDRREDGELVAGKEPF